jgi:hypothetical protein
MQARLVRRAGQQIGSLAKEESASLLLLSSNSYFGGDAELAGNSKELFFNRR